MCLFGEIVSYIHGRKIAIIKGMARYLFQKIATMPQDRSGRVGATKELLEHFGINLAFLNDSWWDIPATAPKLFPDFPSPNRPEPLYLSAF